ncbi:hypothetical protein PT2222_150124 [Paraburkholderia tropica]
MHSSPLSSPHSPHLQGSLPLFLPRFKSSHSLSPIRF